MRILFTALLSFVCFAMQAQYYWNEWFEAPYDYNRSHFKIDTTSYHHNIWQIGPPRKTVFSAASSAPNVIITDTVNHYPVNDTSVFTIYHTYFYTYMFSINFLYKLDIDSGVIAKMEISGDNGLNWINPMTQDTIYQFYWGWTKPRLDTTELTWQNYQLNLDPWVNAYAGGPYTFPHYRTSDTIMFRFTFISTATTSGRDGWMMDNFYLENAIMEGSVKQVLDNDLISIYPNPSKGNIYYKLAANSPDASIVVYDMNGRAVYTRDNLQSGGYLNLPLPNGNYTLRYTTGDYYAIKKLVIIN